MGKRISIFLLTTIIGYIIYYDISIGTFRYLSSSSTQEVSSTVSNESIPYETIQIKSGDTLLSIVEQLSIMKKIPSSKRITEDFQILNPHDIPTKLIIGNSYKIPIYK